MHIAGTQSSESFSGPTSTRRASILVATGGALLFFVIAILLTSLDRPLEWDESDYLLFSVGHPAGPHKALGPMIVGSWLRPLAEASLIGFRVGVLLFHSAAVFIAVFVWDRVRMLSGLIGISILSLTYWLTVFYATEWNPNLLVSLLIAIMIGACLRWLDTKRTAWIVAAGIAAAGMAFWRPTDAAWAIVGVAVALLALSRLRDSGVVLGVVGGGFVLGMVPWIVDGIARYDSIGEKLRLASKAVDSRFALTLGEYVYLIDGPTIWADPERQIAALVFVTVGTIFAIALVAIYQRRRASLFALVVATLLGLPYSFIVSALAPRFFLPSLTLIALAAGVVVADAIDERWASRWSIGIAALGVLLVATIPANLSALERNELDQLRSRSTSLLLSEQATVYTTRPCTVLTHLSYPMFEFYTGCDVVRISAWDGSADRSYVAVSSSVTRITDLNGGFSVVGTLDIDGKTWYFLSLDQN